MISTTLCGIAVTMAHLKTNEIGFVEPVESALCDFKTVPSKMLLGDVKRIMVISRCESLTSECKCKNTSVKFG